MDHFLLPSKMRVISTSTPFSDRKVKLFANVGTPSRSTMTTIIIRSSCTPRLRDSPRWFGKAVKNSVSVKPRCQVRSGTSVRGNSGMSPSGLFSRGRYLSAGKIIVVALYKPAGNVCGEFHNNVFSVPIRRTASSLGSTGTSAVQSDEESSLNSVF